MWLDRGWVLLIRWDRTGGTDRQELIGRFQELNPDSQVGSLKKQV